MSGTSFMVPPLSWDSIRGKTDQVRHILDMDDVLKFPVIEIIEHVLQAQVPNFSLVIGTDATMKRAEGYTSPDGSFIMLNERVYMGACKDEGRARFTAAHELGHWFLHTNVVLARIPDGAEPPAFRLSEPQANQFAAEILMPVRLITTSDTAATVAARFAVSYEAAENRLDFLTRKGFLMDGSK